MPAIPGIVDGSAAILPASPSYAKKHGLKPRAKVVAMANMGDSPTRMLNAPVPATRKVLAKAALGIDEIDLRARYRGGSFLIADVRSRRQESCGRRRSHAAFTFVFRP